jgi:dsDNA-binding SOS-regulon protein
MHDGRIVSLGKVIDHYRNGVDTSQPTLDALLKKRVIISDQEKVDLISFLLTLKDDVLTHDARFKQPD